jgi:uncharacterized protein YjbJ (UPF0337 family)
MSTLVAKGNWNIAKGKLKQTFARLTQDELEFFEGKVDELVGRIQKRAGLSKRQTEPPIECADECGCRHK